MMVNGEIVMINRVDKILVIVRLKFQKRSVLKFVSRTIPP